MLWSGTDNDRPIAGGRDGLTATTALDGTSYNKFYWTPTEFFTSTQDDGADSADTSGGDLFVEDPEGVARKVCWTNYLPRWESFIHHYYVQHNDM